MYKNILVGLDVDDEGAERVLRRAVDLAEHGDASLTLLYVALDFPRLHQAYLRTHADVEYLNEARSKLEALAERAQRPGGRVVTALRSGKPYAELLAEAERIGADLIVIGSHQPTLLDRLLGSNAAAIVRHAKVSVLIERGGAPGR